MILAFTIEHKTSNLYLILASCCTINSPDICRLFHSLRVLNATYRNIVGCNMFRGFGLPVAICKGVVGSSMKMVKFAPTTPNMSQHGATGWPNTHNMLRPTMLRYVAFTCCDRLAGALEGLGTGFTSAYRTIVLSQSFLVL